MKNFHCYWCGRMMLSRGAKSLLAETRDHIVPKSKGGLATVRSCLACNSLKKDMMPMEWQAYREANQEWWKLAVPLSVYRTYTKPASILLAEEQERRAINLGRESVCHEIVDAAVALFRTKTP